MYHLYRYSFHNRILIIIIGSTVYLSLNPSQPSQTIPSHLDKLVKGPFSYLESNPGNLLTTSYKLRSVYLWALRRDILVGSCIRHLTGCVRYSKDNTLNWRMEWSLGWVNRNGHVYQQNKLLKREYYAHIARFSRFDAQTSRYFVFLGNNE